MANNGITITKDTKSGRKKIWLVRWWGTYDCATGKQPYLSKSFATKREAEKFKREKIEEFEMGMPKQHQELTLEELCTEFLSTKKNELKNTTTEGYINTIDQFLSYFPPRTSIKRIQPQQAQQFISSLKIVNQYHARKGKTIAHTTRNKHLRQAKSIFNLAVDWGYLKRNPFKTIKRIKARKAPWHYITPEEFEALLKKTPNLRTKALYAVMYGCGLRFGEAVNMLWDGQNIDFERSIINIRNRRGTKSIPPFNIKDYEDRTVPMPKWVAHMLAELQMESTEHCPFVFLTRDRYLTVMERWESFWQQGKSDQWKNRFLVNNILREFHQNCRNAGINTNEKLTIHCLRKGYACNLANSGKVPIHTLLELMGHSDVSTCKDYYLKNISANKERAVEILEGIMTEPISEESATG